MESDENLRALLSRFASNTLQYLPVAILPSVFMLLGGIVFTRVFTPAEYGIYSFVLAITTPVTTLFTEWVSQPIGRFYAEFHSNDRLDFFERLASTSVLLVAASIFVLGVLIFVFFVFYPDLTGYRLVSAGAIAMVLAQSLSAVVLPILPASFQTKRYRKIIILTSGLSVLVPMLLIMIFKKDISWLLWGQAIATLIFVPYIYKSSNVSFLRIFKQVSPELIKTVNRFCKYGIPMMLWFVTIHLLNFGDRFVLQFFRGSAEVGIYSINYNLVSSVIGLINIPVGIALGPILYRYWQKGSIRETEKTLAYMTEMYFVIALFIVAVMVVISLPLVSVLLGEQFQSGVVIFPAVLFGRLFWGAAIIGQKSLELKERTDLIVKCAFFALAANFLLNLLIVPTLGYIAAAYTTLFSNLFYTFLVWLESRRFIKWQVEKVHYFPYILSFTFAVLAGFAVVHVPSNNFLKIVLSGVTVTVIYGFSILAFARKRLKAVIYSEDFS